MEASDSAPAEVYLSPGESCFARRPTIIRTLLGSCVGATMWTEELRAGAMCHATLPRAPDPRFAPADAAVNRRFVDFAIRELARWFDRLGASRADIQVKLFGGADVLPVGTRDPSRLTVGAQNCEAALQALAVEGLDLAASSVRGTVGYDIRLDTRTGRVFLRRLPAALVRDTR